MFLSANCYHNGDPTASADQVMWTINDSDYYPIEQYSTPSASHEQDSAFTITFAMDGKIKVEHFINTGGSNYHVVFNGFYRFE